MGTSSLESLALTLHALRMTVATVRECPKVVHKGLFVLSCMGYPLRYTFRWYSHGPYAPDLDDALRELQSLWDFVQARLAGWRLTPRTAAIVERFREETHLRTTAAGLPEPRALARLEIAACLLFLRIHYGTDAEDLPGLLLRKRPALAAAPSLVAEAQILLRRLGLLPPPPAQTTGLQRAFHGQQLWRAGHGS